MRTNVANIEIATRRKVVADSKRMLMALRSSLRSEVRRLNRTRPIAQVRATNPDFNGADYLQRPENLADASDAWVCALAKLDQSLVATSRLILRVEAILTDVSDLRKH